MEWLWPQTILVSLLYYWESYITVTPGRPILRARRGHSISRFSITDDGIGRAFFRELAQDARTRTFSMPEA